MYQESNLDITGRMIWKMAPMPEAPKNGAPPFTAIECGMFNARPEFFSKREGADGHLFLYTQSGNGYLGYKGGGYELLPGSAALIDCYERHEYRTFDENDGNWSFYWLHIKSGHTGFYEQLIYRNSFSICCIGGGAAQILDGILNYLPMSDSMSLMHISDFIYKLLLMMINISAMDETGRGKESAIKEMVSDAVGYLKENYWKPLDLDEVAKHCGMSKYHFLRLFKDFSGMTPYRFLTVERVNAARQLLQTTDLQVFEIGVMTGFRDDSNFIRTFKSITGATPQAFRSAIRKR